jgi:hypothetical protein
MIKQTNSKPHNVQRLKSNSIAFTVHKSLYLQHEQNNQISPWVSKHPTTQHLRALGKRSSLSSSASISRAIRHASAKVHDGPDIARITVADFIRGDNLKVGPVGSSRAAAEPCGDSAGLALVLDDFGNDLDAAFHAAFGACHGCGDTLGVGSGPSGGALAWE